MIIHLAALAAAHPAHVSNLRYAAESWTPGGTALAVLILAVLVFAWIRIPSGRRREPAPARTRRAARREAPARR